MKLLDLFCGAGGAGEGYRRAGFEVTGVDIKPQKNYPHRFIQGDALEYVAVHGHEYDAIHASPPCQPFSQLRNVGNSDGHPDLVAQTRDALQVTGLPYVIENVPGAPLRNPLLLCGAMFGLKVYRHRHFESNHLLLAPLHPTHTERFPRAGRGPNANGWMSVAGHFSGVEAAQKAMGINWMGQSELAQAIPPAYTEWIGRQLRNVLLVPSEFSVEPK